MFSRRNDDKPRFAHQVFGSTLGSAILFMVEVLQIIIIAAAIILPIRFFLVKPFIVKGESMEPNFHDSEYLIIDQITYRFRDIERGEVVVFRPPDHPGQFYIKRVIGLPGETVELRDGDIIIKNTSFPNGIVLKEDYLSEYTHGRSQTILGLNEYFLLGDNRDASLDSRRFGPVNVDAIVGKVWIRGLPLDKVGTIHSPEYQY